MEIPEKLKDIIGQLRIVNFAALERTEELGRIYSFKPAADHLKAICNDLKQFEEYAEVLRVTRAGLDQITEIARQARESINRIETFEVKGNDSATSQHQNILASVEKLYDRSLDYIAPLIERAKILSLNPVDLKERVSEALSAVKEIEEIKKSALEAQETIESDIKEVRDTLGSEGALVSAKDFEQQADEHKKLAKRWFWAAIISLAFTALLLIVLINGWWPFQKLSLENAGTDLARIVQVVVYKILLLSVAYLVVYQCLRNYKINQHLYVTNRHRQLTLTVYPLMAKATNDQTQSNTIVAQAAKAIFEQGTTGYLDGDDSPPPVNFTEIVNKVVDKAS